MTNIPEPGVHADIAFADYLRWKGVNASRLKLVGKSAKHYHEHVDTDSDALTLGRAEHTATFEPDRFVLEFTVWEGKARRGKEWDAFAEANAAKSILTISQYNDVLEMRNAVRYDPVAGPIVKGEGIEQPTALHRDERSGITIAQYGHESLVVYAPVSRDPVVAPIFKGKGLAETSVVWTDEPTGILCKGRLDWVTGGVIYDLKTARDITPRRFANSAVEYGYDISAAFYIDGWLAAIGEEATMELIVVEKSPPWDVVVVPLGEDVIEAGRAKYRRLLDEVVRCRRTGDWPGVARGAKVPLRLPEWAKQTGDAELVVGGQLITV